MNRRTAICIPLFFILAGIISCGGGNSPGRSSGNQGAGRRGGEAGPGIYGREYNADSWADDEAIKAAFALNYGPQNPEPEQTPETLNLSMPASGGQGQQIIPGLRKLNAYKTSYIDPLTNTQRIQAIAEAQAAAQQTMLTSAVNEPLTVIDWGPRGLYSSAIQRPSIFIIFSHPMTALASLGQPSSASPIVTISPAIKGVFRWYGTGFLSFEGEEPCQSQQTYTITVSPNAASIQGQKISGETRFSFETETLSITAVLPGEEFKKQNNFYFLNNSVPPEAAREIHLRFNYPVSLNDIRPFIAISTGFGGEKKFNLTQPEPYVLLASLSDPVEFNTEVSVVLKQGAKSGNGTLGTKQEWKYTFRTPDPFKVNEHRRASSYGKYRNIVEIRFSHALNERTAVGGISTEPAMTLTQDNIEIYGSTLRVYNLPVTYGDKFTIKVDAGIEDIYGRRLGAQYSAAITVPPAPPPVGEANFLEYSGSVRMLEAQFPPRFLFEYRNLATGEEINRHGEPKGSWYQLAGMGNPFSRDLNDNIKIINLAPKEINARYFEEIDLMPFLNSGGRGFVFFNANIALKTDRVDRETGKYEFYRQSNTMNIQVTDLGITVRYGFNKAAVLVTSLATGKPVEGATVRLISPYIIEEYTPVAELAHFGEAVTNRNGLAVIALKGGRFRDETSFRYDMNTPYVYAEKDGDQAVFAPRSHNAYAFDVDSSYPKDAEQVSAVTFMFSDRGLYKPGETLTFKGVDRSMVLGMYSIYQGDYEVSLMENRYSGQTIANIQGETTDSGGFHGSITLPEDLSPGSYSLFYRRSSQSDAVANIHITVAYFERLRFQASISRPPMTIVTGDDINMTLEASYLSGGSLSGSSYQNYWYREMAWFRPSTAETSGYFFGPRQSYDSNRNISSGNGMLSANGSATLSQKTGGEAVAGSPYYYSVEAQVTDISNQMISALQSVMVHPARFYLGILPRSSRGFTRAGQELTFDYLMVTPDGNLAANTNLVLANGTDAGKMKVEVIREEWNRVQQQGVGGYIYDQYKKEMVEDSVQSVNLRPGGSFKIKPSRAGFYILRVSSADRDGKRVLTEYTFYVTGSGRGYWNMDNPGELRLTPDQPMYKPGDTAQVLLQSSLPEGWYLITVEREGIYTEEVLHITESTRVLDIPIAQNFVPVVYVSVSSYSVRSGPPSHTYGSPDLDKPKGYFGVTALNVNPRVRAFSVKVESDKKTYRPGEEVTMTLTAERDGRPLPGAELTLMAVDRGVLDLINYHVPDPIAHFYDPSRFPLYVMGGDSRAWLMDPVTYSVKNLSGGDEGGDKLEERKDFNPTAVFEPLLKTGPDGKVLCKFRLPDSLTTYRVTVFGVREDIFAIKESEIAAQNRINVREVLPRRLRERDTAEAGVLISNLDSSSHRISVALSITGPDSQAGSGFAAKTGEAFVDGPAEHTITVRSGENAVVYFDVAGQREGGVSLNFTIKSDVLNERLIQRLVIEKPYIKETVTTTGSLDASSDTRSEALVIPSFADDGVGDLKVSLDATRLALLEAAVDYVFRYPYGCLEQRSSAVLPLVIFGEYMDVFGLKSDVANPAEVVTSELREWSRCQRPDGGFPYWPSGLESSIYVSLRVAHIYALAKQKNILLPSGFGAQALLAYLNNQYQKMQSWNNRDYNYYYQSYLQSYMLYVMSMLGERFDPSRIAEILGRNNVDPSVLAFAGMAYLNINRNDDAAAAGQRLRNLLRPTARGVDITDPLDKHRSSFYGGPIEQLALTLQFFARQYPGDAINTRLLFSLLEQKRAAGYWSNTASTSRVLEAVDTLIRAENLAATDVTGKISLAGAELLSGHFKGLAAKPVSGAFDFKETPISGLARDSMIPLNISRNGTGSLHYTASLTYAIPAELQYQRDEGLGLFISLEDAISGEAVKGTALVSGKTYRARIRLSSGRDRTYVALRVPIPSGAEILDAAFVTTASFPENNREEMQDSQRNRSWVSHQAILDNEIHYFWDAFYKGENTVEFLFRTARRGVFPTPPAQAECMYEPEIFGRTAGFLYTIQ